MLSRATLVTFALSISIPVIIFIVRPEPGYTRFAWFILFFASLLISCFLSSLSFKLGKQDYCDLHNSLSIVNRIYLATLLLPCVVSGFVFVLFFAWIIA